MAKKSRGGRMVAAKKRAAECFAGDLLGSPSAIFSPWSSTVMRSETPITTFMSCSMRRIVRPRSSRSLRMKSVRLGRLLRVHARRGLVEQQQARVGGERPRDLDAALVAVGRG